MTHLHTALRVSDLEASVDFYAELLGYETVREMETDDGVRNVFVGHPDPDALDDAALQLVPADGPVDPGDLEHVALATEDVDAAVASLDDELVDGEPRTLPEAGLRVAYVRDLDGYGVELVEHL